MEVVGILIEKYEDEHVPGAGGGVSCASLILVLILRYAGDSRAS